MKVWGAQVRPPSVDRAVAAWLLNAGLMGREERRFFENTVTAGQTVVDVGANQGIFTLLFSRLVGREGRVVALEPEPGLFAALDGNCRRNGADHVTRLQMAAGEKRAQGVLHCSRFNRGDNRLSDSLAGPSVSVNIAALDDLLPTETVNLIKIDVQGYELQVVKGMQQMLDRVRDIKVFFEYWPAGLGYAGTAAGELPDFFLSRGFSLFALHGGGVRKLSGDGLAKVRQAAGHSARARAQWTNLLAVRE
jgi:FkbM family methyltransferase